MHSRHLHRGCGSTREPPATATVGGARVHNRRVALISCRYERIPRLTRAPPSPLFSFRHQRNRRQFDTAHLPTVRKDPQPQCARGRGCIVWKPARPCIVCCKRAAGCGPSRSPHACAIQIQLHVWHARTSARVREGGHAWTWTWHAQGTVR